MVEEPSALDSRKKTRPVRIYGMCCQLAFRGHHMLNLSGSEFRGAGFGVHTSPLGDESDLLPAVASSMEKGLSHDP